MTSYIPSVNTNNARRCAQSDPDATVQAAPDTSINNGRTIEKLSYFKKFKQKMNRVFRIDTLSVKKTHSAKNQRNVLPKQSEMQENPVYEKFHAPTNIGYAEIIATPVAHREHQSDATVTARPPALANDAPLPDSDRYWNSVVEAENAGLAIRSPIAFSMPVIEQRSAIVKKALEESPKPASRKAQENTSATTLSSMVGTIPATASLSPQDRMQAWKEEILAPVSDRLKKFTPEEFESTEVQSPRKYRDFFIVAYKKAFEEALDKTIAQVAVEKNSSVSRKDLITMTFEKLDDKFNTDYELPGEIPIFFEWINRQVIESFLPEMHAKPARRGIGSLLASSTQTSLKTLSARIKGKITGRAQSYNMDAKRESSAASAENGNVQFLGKFRLPNTD